MNLRDRRVRVYRNIRTGRWSIQDCKTGRVIGSTGVLVMRDVEFVVRPGGRERTLRQKRKNVHAFAVGYVLTLLWPPPEEALHVSYNPYKHASFVDQRGRPVANAHRVMLDYNGVVRAW